MFLQNRHFSSSRTPAPRRVVAIFSLAHRNLAATTGFSNIFDGVNSLKFHVFLSFSTFATWAQRGGYFVGPKSAARRQLSHKLVLFLRLALEVLQKPFLTSPCCMGSVFFCASHATCGRQNAFQHHLCSDNATFLSFFASPTGSPKITKSCFSKSMKSKNVRLAAVASNIPWRHPRRPPSRPSRAKQTTKQQQQLTNSA